jgi:hypothetical protein
VYGEFREYISHGLPSLDIDVAEILLEDNTAYTGIGFQGYLDDFSFSIGRTDGKESGFVRRVVRCEFVGGRQLCGCLMESEN